MTDTVEIQPVASVQGTIRPPGSKSITNRALICAALADGNSTLCGVLDSDDTRVMTESLSRLGIKVTTGSAPDERIVSGGGGSVPQQKADLFVGNSGTTVRFLTAMLAAGEGEFRLDGVPRMRQRPIQDLLDALNQLGADARCESNSNCPPVLLRANGLNGGHVNIRGELSSQYLSGLLMASPYARQPVVIEVTGELVSRPYVAMTCAVMESFGVPVDTREPTRITVPVTHSFRATRYQIEPDASAASYFWAAAAIASGTVFVEGLTRDAIQGDVQFCECLEQMGCRVDYQQNGIAVTGDRLRGIDVDMNAISDTAQTLAAVAIFAEGPTRIHGIKHNRHKETDRIADLATEIRKLGAHVDEWDDGFQITPGPLHGAVIDTYDDHRMAMSMALAGLRIPGVEIRDPSCTAKTYPNFFQDLASIRA